MREVGPVTPKASLAPGASAMRIVNARSSMSVSPCGADGRALTRLRRSRQGVAPARPRPLRPEAGRGGGA
jgi:hypothetical protein